MTRSRLLLLLTPFALGAPASRAAIDSYQGADRALSVSSAGSGASTPASTKLFEDIDAFERDPPKQPAAAAKEFAALLDRFTALKPADATAAMQRGEEISPQRVFRALPPPETWPALAEIWRARAATPNHHVSDEALAIVGKLLMGKRDEVRREASTVLAKLSRAQGTGDAAWMAQAIDEAFTDKPTDLVARIDRISKKAVGGWQAAEDIPDLVALVGPAKAKEHLATLLAVPGLEIVPPIGSATERLARELLAERIDQLPSAHWALVGSDAPSALFEAMERRFVPPGSAIGPTASARSAPGNGDTNEHIGNARVAYVISLLREKKSEAAISALRRLGRTNIWGLNNLMKYAIERDVVDQLADVLEVVLDDEHLPGLWPVRREAALRAGKADRALAVLKSHIKRAAPTDALALTAELVSLQLALDQVDAAVATIRSAMTGRDGEDPALRQSRVGLAVQLAKVGRATLKREWIDEAAQAALNHCADAGSSRAKCDALTDEVIGGLLAVDRGPAAERLLMKQLESSGMPAEQRPYMQSSTMRSLAEVYGTAGRHADVLLLLTRFPGWQVNDVIDLDRFGAGARLRVPIALRAAEALIATGKPDIARQLLKAYLQDSDNESHIDRAYGLLARLDGEALLPWLEEQVKRDRFEERPLIWRAQLLGQSGDLKAAEATARAAIAMDPSDGEQKRGDRLRAYSVLAEVLNRQGRLAEAKQIEQAISAIRASEDADALREAGLTTRAIAAYAKAGTQFADAYCIQARLAVELEAAGRLRDAQKHYERAFELMPSSFGRVETHCFGCEGVFDSQTARTSAERILTRFVAAHPDDARAPYLLGYVYKSQHRAPEAAAMFKRAFERDPDYLNAYIKFLDVAEDALVTAEERERAALAIVRLDTTGRRLSCSNIAIRDLRALYRAASARPKADTHRPDLFTLTAAAAANEKRNGGVRSRLPRGACGGPGAVVANQPAVGLLLGPLRPMF